MSYPATEQSLAELFCSFYFLLISAIDMKISSSVDSNVPLSNVIAFRARYKAKCGQLSSAALSILKTIAASSGYADILKICPGNVPTARSGSCH